MNEKSNDKKRSVNDVYITRVCEDGKCRAARFTGISAAAIRAAIKTGYRVWQALPDAATAIGATFPIGTITENGGVILPVIPRALYNAFLRAADYNRFVWNGDDINVLYKPE